MGKQLVQDCPTVIASKSLGEMTFELNSKGSVEIGNKYEPTSFVVDDLRGFKAILDDFFFQRFAQQIFHQNKADRSEVSFLSQHLVFSTADMKSWVDRVVAENPAPDGCEFLFCNAQSDFFVWATTE